MSERKRAEYGTGEDMERKADWLMEYGWRNGPEYWAIVCPSGGKHDVRNMEYGPPLLDIDRSRLMLTRMCIRCGLFDRFIEESE